MKYAPDVPDEHTGRNLAPLIGVLVALMVVFLASVPREHAFAVGDPMRGCLLCGPDGCEPVTDLRVSVADNGLVRIDGREMPATAIATAVRWHPSPDVRAFVSVEVDPDADYGDAVAVLAELRRVGVPESALRIDAAYR